MSRKITFDELVARRERRENDKLKVGMLTIPGTGVGLEARMPPQKAVLALYGEMGSAKDTMEALRCGHHSLYVWNWAWTKIPWVSWMSCSHRWSRTSWAARLCGSWGCCRRCRKTPSLPAPMGSRPRTQGLRR